MVYAVTHLTIYKYSDAISDSTMELRMQPRSDTNQRCRRFTLDISPEVKAASYKDYLGNMIHNFNIHAPHRQLAIKAEALVDVKPLPNLPDSLPLSAWDALDAESHERDYYDFLLDGRYTKSSLLLETLASELDWRRRSDPLSLLRELNSHIYEAFDYEQHVTKVDSSIDVALASRRGVCQDFTHIMLTLVRQIGIPARYISGYLFHQREKKDRSDEDASHAWLEAWLPELGWIGFDPTNNLLVNDRHIRVSVASDYAEASPSKGVFKGNAKTELEVRVQVSQLEEMPEEEISLAPEISLPRYEFVYQEQQQQQQ
jgi:transglutaminase-like putative cysteine protease